MTALPRSAPLLIRNDRKRPARRTLMVAAAGALAVVLLGGCHGTYSYVSAGYVEPCAPVYVAPAPVVYVAPPPPRHYHHHHGRHHHYHRPHW